MATRLTSGRSNPSRSKLIPTITSIWPILNALINAVNGASWVSYHHGGGVGIGYSLHAGMVIVADGTHAADERISRVLDSDPGMGIARHADAGYLEAQKNAHAHQILIPGLTLE